jgi:ELWxxDGT repeat protein
MIKKSPIRQRSINAKIRAIGARNRRRLRTYRAAFEFLEQRQLMAGLPQQLIINPAAASNGSIPEAGEFANVNGTLFLRAFEGNAGTELWKSDGTVAGTTLVKDIVPGGTAAGSHPQRLTNVNGTLFFFAKKTLTARFDLWKSDGTANGTVLVKDFGNEIGYYNVPKLTNANGTLFFFAPESAGQTKLWKSDGTTTGTIPVKNTVWTSLSQTNQENVNGTFYFAANDGTTGRELWKSDGTSAGTTLVKNIGASDAVSSTASFTNVNGTLFFSARQGNGYELWRSDGTSSSTVQVKDIYPGISHSDPRNLINVNGTLFFHASEGTVGRELFKSDGTATGTVVVKDIRTGNQGSASDIKFANVNGTLFFIANDGTNGYELWKSDGTTTGTTLVKNITPGAAPAFPSQAPHHLTNVNGTLFLSANDGTSGMELWKSNGTASGTVLVQDLHSGANYSVSELEESVRPIAANGRLFFAAHDGSQGRELWTMDGGGESPVQLVGVKGKGVIAPPYNPFQVKELGVKGTGVSGIGVLPPTPPTETSRLTDIAGAASSDPRDFTNVNGIVYFTAGERNVANSRRLWKTDGTMAGTGEVFAVSGLTYANPANLINVNGLLYFTAEFATSTSGQLGIEIGRVNSAFRIKQLDVHPGASSSNPSNLTNVAGVLFFTADDSAGVTGSALWASRGEGYSTTLVANDVLFDGDGPGSGPKYLTNVSGVLYFTVKKAGLGRELWRSLGTYETTAMVKDIQIGAGGSDPKDLTNVGGTLFFTANTTSSGRELWKSTSITSAEIVHDVNVGVGSSAPSSLTNVKGNLYFAAHDGTTGRELWIHATLNSTTTRVKDINPNAANSDPDDLTNLNGVLMFTANDGVVGRELWRSNGVGTGTVIVKDIRAGATGSNPDDLVALNGKLYFSADDGLTGRELWTSFISNNTVTQVADIRPGPLGSLPVLMTPGSSNLLVFSATDGVNGREAWVLRNPIVGGSSVGPQQMSPPESPSDMPEMGPNIPFGGLSPKLLLPNSPSEFDNRPKLQTKRDRGETVLIENAATARHRRIDACFSSNPARTRSTTDEFYLDIRAASVSEELSNLLVANLHS